MRRRQFLSSTLAAGSLMASGTTQARTAKADLALHVPPEEDRHEATFMMWPVSLQVYGDRTLLHHVQRTIAEIANTIVHFEPVILLAHADDHAAAKRLLSGKVTLWDIPTEDLWARDAGPLFAKDARGNRVVSHLKFNGWGRKQVHTRDAQIAARVAAALDMPLIDSGLIGEAGGVEHDGHGLLMAHESSWVIANRNPGLPKAEIEAQLLQAYGADRMIWATGVKGQDITDYHIDSLARFTGPGQVLINLPDDPDMSDPVHRAAVETHDILEAAGLDLTVIPEPEVRRVQSLDFVASYANYYACNGAIITAQFGDSITDALAKKALKRAYPDREVIPLNVDALGEMGGGIHCATQQLPA